MRQPGQQRRFAERQLADVLAEEGLRGGLRAVGQVAVVNLVQVEFQHFLRRLALAQQKRQQDFLDLALNAALVAIFVAEQDVADDLLRDRAAAAVALRQPDVLQEGARGRLNFEAGVGEEGVVLDGDGRVDQVLRELIVADVGALAFVEGFVEQLAGAVVDRTCSGSCCNRPPCATCA